MIEHADMDDILQEFVTESWENLNQLDAAIVELEKRHGDPDLLAAIFRSIHTIKGTCGFIGLSRLGALAHSTENVLGQMRNGDLEPSPEAISMTLRAVDQIKELLTKIEETGQEPDTDHSTLINQLELLAGIPEAFRTRRTANTPDDGPGDDLHVEASTPCSPTVPVESPQQAAASAANATQQKSPAPAASKSDAGTNTKTPIERSESDTSSVPSGTAGATSASAARHLSELSIRVNVDVIDRLMNMVGELVLTRNQLLQLARGDEESKYAAPIAHLNRVTTDLQEGVMKTRMQQIGSIWGKLPRLVRDLCQVTGKQIDLKMHGAETELDRTVLDAIRDPLTHMVRNSADHGIESAEVRLQRGKPEAGTLTLNACHEGGHVIICIEDDGAGINVERVRQKAISNGLVTDADARKMSDQEIVQFIFAPGFSTAEQVTSVSGRGVGMDVVRTQIEQIGGTVDLLSRAGLGTMVRIKIPLTLAIVSALVVESGEQSFAIPQLGVVELVRLAVEDQHRIERIHEHQVYRLRDRLLPLVRLDHVLQVQQKHPEGEADINIVVVQVGEEQLGLVVDEVFDTEEIVVKPVGRLLKDISIYQGTTILGDGRVIIILDVAGIAAGIGNLSAVRKEAAHADSDRDGEGSLTSMLLFDAGDGQTMCVPLSLVSRLEEIPRDRIERTGDRDVVQYRGDLLPLLPVAGKRSAESATVQPVIVFSEQNHAMGLMVEEIEDIVEEHLVIRMHSNRPGVLGTAIVNGKATDILDARYYVLQTNPDWFENNQIQHEPRVLLAEDSVFFRQLAATALESSGCVVTTVPDGMKATEMLERGDVFDVIISDIEMPVMGGLAFARWVRKHQKYDNIPLVALSGNTSSTLQQRTTEAGFDHFIRKFDPEQLKSLVENLCAHKASIHEASA